MAMAKEEEFNPLDKKQYFNAAARERAEGLEKQLNTAMDNKKPSYYKFGDDPAKRRTRAQQMIDKGDDISEEQVRAKRMAVGQKVVDAASRNDLQRRMSLKQKQMEQSGELPTWKGFKEDLVDPVANNPWTTGAAVVGAGSAAVGMADHAQALNAAKNPELQTAIGKQANRQIANSGYDMKETYNSLPDEYNPAKNYRNWNSKTAMNRMMESGDRAAAFESIKNDLARPLEDEITELEKRRAKGPVNKFKSADGKSAWRQEITRTIEAKRKVMDDRLKSFHNHMAGQQAKTGFDPGDYESRSVKNPTAKGTVRSNRPAEFNVNAPDQYNPDGTKNTAAFNNNGQPKNTDPNYDNTPEAKANLKENKLLDKGKEVVNKGATAVKDATDTSTIQKAKDTFGKYWNDVGYLKRAARFGGPTAAVALAILDGLEEGKQGWEDEGVWGAAKGGIKGAIGGATFDADEGIVDSFINKQNEGKGTKIAGDIIKKGLNIPSRFGNWMGEIANDVVYGDEHEYKPFFPTLATTANGGGIDFNDTSLGELTNSGQAINDAKGFLKDTPLDPKRRSDVSPAATRAEASLGLKEPTRPMQKIAGVAPTDTGIQGISKYQFGDDNQQYGNAPYYTNVGKDGKTFSSGMGGGQGQPQAQSQKEQMPPVIKYALEKYGTFAGQMPFADIVKEFGSEQDRRATTGIAQEKALSQAQKDVRDLSMLAVSGEAKESNMAINTMIQQAQYGSEKHKQALANVLASRTGQKIDSDWWDMSTWNNKQGDSGMNRDQNTWRFGPDGSFGQRMVQFGDDATMNYSEFDEIEKQIFNTLMSQKATR